MVLVVSALVLAACISLDPPADDDGRETAADPQDGAAPDVADGPGDPGEDLPPELIEVATWSGDHLPPVAGSAVIVDDDIAVLYVAEDTTLFVLAVDVETGEERWRAPAHHQGRYFDEVTSPTVDPDLGLVIVGDHDEDGDGAQLVAYDLVDGQERWRVATLWVRSGPWRCDEDLLCSIGVEGMALHRREDGRVQHRSRVSFDEIVGGRGDVVVTASDDPASVQLGVFADGRHRSLWARTVTQIWEADGSKSTSAGSWRSYVNDQHETVALSLAPTIESVADGSIVDQGVALVTYGGRVVGSWDRGVLCFGRGHDGRVIVCDELEAVAADEAAPTRHDVEDGPDGMVPVFRRVSALDAGSGELVWEISVPPDEPAWRAWGSLDATGLWTVEDTTGREVVLDLGDGSMLDLDEVSGHDSDLADGGGRLLRRCAAPAPDSDATHVELVQEGGETVQFRAFDESSLLGVCDLGEAEHDPVELLASNALPSWFGISFHLDSDDGDGEGANLNPVPEGELEEEQPADALPRWTLWVDADGRVHGLGPAD